jgi:hypothetical protein
VSLSAVRNIDAKCGLFLRANGASGVATPIETSVAWGGIYNNPLGRNKLDEVGLGVFWDKDKSHVAAAPNLRSASRSPWVIDRLLKNQNPLEKRNNLRSSSPHLVLDRRPGNRAAILRSEIHGHGSR